MSREVLRVATTREQVQAAAELIGDIVGLRPTAATESRLAGGMNERAADRQVSIEDYLKVLAEDANERQQLLELLSVQETSWFRDRAQFDALADHILPTIKGPVTVWSAGCATGQEVYSLAILLEEQRVREWRIIASDLSLNAVERTKAARYRESELRSLSTARRNRWFHRSGQHWEVAPQLRARVHVVRHNLAFDPPPIPPGDCQIVFCRNVFIYLRRERIAAFLDRLHGSIAPGGHMFLGMSEVLWRVENRFELVRLGEAFAYKRIDEAAKPAPAPAREPVPAPPRPAPTTTLGRRVARRRPDVSPAVLAEDSRKAGEAAARAGRHEEAIEAFRRAVYLNPDDPLAHLNLGIELEAAGDRAAGERAFRAALAALERAGDRQAIESRLEGYGLDAVTQLLTSKLGGQ